MIGIDVHHLDHTCVQSQTHASGLRLHDRRKREARSAQGTAERKLDNTSGSAKVHWIWVICIPGNSTSLMLFQIMPSACMTSSHRTDWLHPAISLLTLPPQSAYNDAKGEAKDLGQQAKDQFNKAKGAVEDFASDVKGDAKDATRDVKSGGRDLKSDAKSAARDAKNEGKNLADRAGDAIKDVGDKLKQ